MRKLLHITVLFLGVLVSSSGCVSTTLRLSQLHPGRSDAAAGVVARDPAAVLRPDAALYQAEMAPREVSVGVPDGTRARPYLGRGIIREVANGSLLIQHEAILGFMGAMTMAYSLSKEVDVKGFAAGDTVTFSIEKLKSGGFEIFNIQKAEAPKPAAEFHEHEHE